MFIIHHETNYSPQNTQLFTLFWYYIYVTQKYYKKNEKYLLDFIAKKFNILF